MFPNTTTPSNNLLPTLLQLLGLVTGFFCGAGTLWCLFDPCWKASSADLAVQPYSICYGIWIGCTINSDGSWVCDGYFGKTVIDLNISPRQHYCRAAAICGFILISFSLMLGGYGSYCCKIKSLRMEQKNKCTCVSGWFALLAGTLVASAGSWYLWEIYMERRWYHQAENAGLGYTIGRGIWLALASGLLGLISVLKMFEGVCQLISKSECWSGEDTDDLQFNTNFRDLPVPSKRTHRPRYQDRHYSPRVPSEYI